MVAFVPISPAAARRLLAGIGEVDSGVLLGDFVEHGLIKAYARVVETLSTGGGREEVRDARIPVSIWKRIVADNKLSDVWMSGSVRLEGDGLVGGRPAVNVIGIRFEERSDRDFAIKHAADPVLSTPLVSPTAKAAKKDKLAAVLDEAAPATSPAVGTDASPLLQAFQFITAAMYEAHPGLATARDQVEATERQAKQMHAFIRRFREE